MAKRKKRLERGIRSIKNQIELHKEKRERAETEENEELTRYYDKEIKALEERKKDRENKMGKQ
ncbi:MAG: hypothetical protein AABX12_05505 [Nanoarchaeota archaeon]